MPAEMETGVAASRFEFRLDHLALPWATASQLPNTTTSPDRASADVYVRCGPSAALGETPDLVSRETIQAQDQDL